MHNLATVPDFTPEQQARFARNDLVAEDAARVAETASSGAGPVATTGPPIPGFELEDLPF